MWQKRRSQVIWGKFPIPHDLTNYHFFATGAAGSGKSSLLRILYRSVLPDVEHKEFDTRAFFYDQKGEAYSDLVGLKLQHETIITNPFDSRCFAWDMADDIRTDGDAKEVASIMVPPIEGQNKYFHDAAALMLTKAIQCLLRLRGRDWSFRDVMLACSNIEDLKSLCLEADLSEIDRLDDFMDKTREGKSVRMTLTVENSKYSVIAAAWEEARKRGDTFSLKKWVNGVGPQILLIGFSDDYPTALATVDRLLIRKAQQLLLSYKEGSAKTGRRTWMLLDEFPSLGPISHLDRFPAEGRSRGICVVLGFQHIAQIRHHYKQLSDAILGQCTHQAYFKANDAEMGRWCADQFGRLITYDEQGHIKHNDPAATENDFTQGLDVATEQTGFQCIIRSSKMVLPSGPQRIEVKPRKDLEAPDPRKLKPDEVGFLKWEKEPILKPWDAEERERLGLPPSQVEAPEVPLPEIPLFVGGATDFEF